MRKLLLFFLFCGALAFLLISYRVPLVEQIARFALSRTGFTEVVCDIGALSADTLTLRTFSLTHTIQGKKYSFTLHDASLGFTLEGLLKKQLHNVAVKQAIITLPEKEPSAPRTPLALPSEQELENKLTVLDRLVLPVDHLSVDQLLLNNGPLPGLQGAPITVHLRRTADTLTAQATLPIEAGETVLVKLLREANTTYHAVLELHSDQDTQSLLDLKLTREQLRGSGTIDLHRLTHWYPQLGIPPGCTGTATYNFSAVSTAGPAIQLKSSFSNLKTDAVAIREGTLELTALLRDLSHITLQENSLLTLQGIHGRTTIDSARLGLGATITLTPEEIRISPTTADPWLISGIDAGPSRIKTIQFFPPLITRGSNFLELVPPSSAPISMQNLEVAGLQVPSLELSPTTAIPVRIEQGEEGALTVLSPPWQTGRVTIHKAEQHVTADQVLLTTRELSLQAGKIAGVWSMDAGNLSLASPPYLLPIYKVQAKITMNDQSIHATLDSAFPAHSGHLRLDVEHNLRNRQGKAQLMTKEPIIFTQDHGLEHLIQGLNLPVKLSAGQLQLSSEMEWKEKKSPQVAVKAQLTQGAGSAAQLTFSGAAASHQLTLLPELRSITPGTLTIERVLGPVLLENLHSSFTLAPSDHGVKPALRVDRLSSNLLDGTVHTVPFTYDPNTTDHLITAKVRHIDLATVARLFKVKGLEVEGTMSGTIPLLVEGKTLSVAGGTLVGDARGGTIRYTVAGLAEQQSQLTAYALKALEEFHFSVLRAPVTYRPDGTLLVDIHLQGTSPSLETSRPVHLNVHTEQNLLSLLKSLKYDKVFTDELNSRLQKQPQQP